MAPRRRYQYQVITPRQWLPPTITGRSPINGPEAGGTTVTITGKNFVDVVSVSFGGFPAASFVVNNQTTITAVTGAQPANFVDITVTTDFGTSPTGANDTFTFDPTPVTTQTAFSFVTAGVVVATLFQYQAVAQPVLVPATGAFDQCLTPWRSPLRVKPALTPAHQQSLAEPVFVPTAPAAGQVAPLTQVDVRIQYEHRLQYQAYAAPIATVRAVTEDEWHQPWSTPVQQKAGLAAQRQQFLAAPPFEDTQEPGATYESPWHQPWSTPVREKPGLRASLQQFQAFQLNDETQIIQNFESRWHYAWSEPVRQKLGLLAAQQQSYAAPIFITETITVDKWFASWREPVREKPGLRASLQQFTAFQLDDETQIIQTYESRWHYAWSEPVRVRALATAQQQTVAQGEPSFELVTIDKWFAPFVDPAKPKTSVTTANQPQPALYPTPLVSFSWYNWLADPVRVRAGLPAGQQQFFATDTAAIPTSTLEPWFAPWSEPVRTRQLFTAQQQSYAAPVAVGETVTLDKWYASWREPVREKPGLRASLQQFLAFQLDDETQIIQTYESRWHYPWSEPVRVRQLATAQQQATAQGEPSFETVTVDKWTYPWTEPVRQKPGLGAVLQQAFIGTVLNPDTQITQGYESRWHYAWSEPVRVKPQVLAAEQPFLAAPAEVVENITLDKWFAQWREPVRQKPGLSAHLQQFFAEVLNPETQIIQGFESRWHYPWSEPVRTRQLAAAQQQSFTNPPTSVFENVTVDKWFAPLREPVRIVQRAAWYQPFTSDTVLTVRNATNESLWHQPWSEPNVKVRRPAPWFQPFTVDTAAIPTSKLETWYQPLSEPSVKARRPAAWYQPFITDTAVIPTKRLPTWFYPWSEPVRVQRLATAQQQSVAFQPVIRETVTSDKWNYAWSEPVRIRPALSTASQLAFAWGLFTPAAAVQQLANFIPISAGIQYQVRVQYQSFAVPVFAPTVQQVSLTLLATEVNIDSVEFGIIPYNAAVSASVSVREVQALYAAAVSIEE